MQDVDKQGAVWQIDKGLKTRARQLQNMEEYADLISHVDIDQVIFARVSNKKADWLGKCYFFGKPPLTLISKHSFMVMNDYGMLDLSKVSNVDEDFLDVRFAIVINDDKMNMIEENVSLVEERTLVHEMMHIAPGADKLVKHDVEDFALLIHRYGPYWTSGNFSGTFSKSEAFVDESN